MVSVDIRARRSVSVAASPLTYVLVVPKVEIITGGTNITITAPENVLTEITASNEDTQLGSGGFAKAAYDHIEAGSEVRVFALPFAVDPNDNADTARLTRVVTALGALESSTELAKLPNRTCDFVIVPNETGRGTGANTVIARLKTLLDASHLGAIGIVDAGPTGGSRTQAAVTAWEAANVDPNIWAISNSGNVSGYDGMPGSVIAAAHESRQVSRYGVQAQPANLRDAVLGVSGISPVRNFDERDSSSEARVLAATPIYLSSLITWNGINYVWGGQTQHADGDPRINLGNNVVANRIVKEARRIIAPALGLRGSPRVLDGLSHSVQEFLEGAYVPAALQSVDVSDASITSGHVSITVQAQFYDFINSVSLTAEVFTQ